MVILGGILIFVLVEGLLLFNIDIILGDNKDMYLLSMKLEYVEDGDNFLYEFKDGEYFSKRYGVVVIDDKILEGLFIICFIYIDLNLLFICI